MRKRGFFNARVWFCFITMGSAPPAMLVRWVRCFECRFPPRLVSLRSSVRLSARLSSVLLWCVQGPWRALAAASAGAGPRPLRVEDGLGGLRLAEGVEPGDKLLAEPEDSMGPTNAAGHCN